MRIRTRDLQQFVLILYFLSDKKGTPDGVPSDCRQSPRLTPRTFVVQTSEMLINTAFSGIIELSKTG